LLHRFLYKPVLGLVDARRAKVDNQLAQVHAAEERVAADRAAVESERDGIAGERLAAMREAAAVAEQQAEVRRERAESEAAALLVGARKTLSDERTSALAEVRRETLDLAAQIAGRLLAQVPMALRAEAWIERIEQYLAELPTENLADLKQQLANGAPLKIVTASELAPDVGELWSSRLKGRLGSTIKLEYGVDASLIAGSELHFPTAILRFSWQTALDAMRAEIETDAEPH
jgi:F-type H+-transporting ATPase subunit b